jgi:hypothetical protein
MAGLFVIIGLSGIFAPDFILELIPEVSSLGSAGVTLFVVRFLAFGILYFFLGRGLWQVRNWARITAIILAIFNLINVLLSFQTSFVQALIWTIVYAGIAGYLLFNKEAKAMYSNKV